MDKEKADVSPQMMVKHCYRGTKNVHGVAEKLDNGSRKYYKEKWHGKNPFISGTLTLRTAGGGNLRYLAWIMLKEDLAQRKKSKGEEVETSQGPGEK